MCLCSATESESVTASVNFVQEMAFIFFFFPWIEALVNCSETCYIKLNLMFLKAFCNKEKSNCIIQKMNDLVNLIWLFFFLHKEIRKCSGFNQMVWMHILWREKMVENRREEHVKAKITLSYRYLKTCSSSSEFCTSSLSRLQQSKAFSSCCHLTSSCDSCLVYKKHRSLIFLPSTQ